MYGPAPLCVRRNPPSMYAATLVAVGRPRGRIQRPRSPSLVVPVNARSGPALRISLDAAHASLTRPRLVGRRAKPVTSPSSTGACSERSRGSRSALWVYLASQSFKRSGIGEGAVRLWLAPPDVLRPRYGGQARSTDSVNAPCAGDRIAAVDRSFVGFELQKPPRPGQTLVARRRPSGERLGRSEHRQGGCLVRARARPRHP